VRLRGRLDGATLGEAWRGLLPAVRRAARPNLVIEAGEADVRGVSSLSLFAELRRLAGGRAEIRGLEEHARALLERLPLEDPAPEPREPLGRALLAGLGRRAENAWRELLGALAFVGEFALHAARAVRHPSRVGWREILRTADRAGTDALPILLLLGFLLGVILAFQSASSLRKFGAEGYVAELVGISMVKELGPLMAAIVLAARSGSAFAAELGTMKINEEIDALRTMGIPPQRFLVLPRVAGVLLVVPVMAVFTILAGLFGGLLIVGTFGMPLASYAERISRTVTLGVWLGALGKTIAFGLLVAGAACLRGLGTEIGALSVGASTTRSVVHGIVLIILADAFFSFLYFRWGF